MSSLLLAAWNCRKEPPADLVICTTTTYTAARSDTGLTLSRAIGKLADLVLLNRNRFNLPLHQVVSCKSTPDRHGWADPIPSVAAAAPVIDKPVWGS